MLLFLDWTNLFKQLLKKFPKRPGPQREPYPRILIVCEGSKTEPYYFKGLIDYFKLSTANVIVEGGSGSAPVSVVRYAKREYKKDKSFDRIYCVIDKDQHTTYNQAIGEIKTFKPKGVLYAAYSVPCFEFWLLLHFVNTTKPFASAGKRSPCDQVIADLKTHLSDYQKGNQNIFLQIIDRLDVALENAERVNKQADQNDTDNPSTKVCILVKDLRDLKTVNKST